MKAKDVDKVAKRVLHVMLSRRIYKGDICNDFHHAADEEGISTATGDLDKVYNRINELVDDFKNSLDVDFS